MSLSLVVGGLAYTNFTSWSIDRDLLRASDTWSVQVADPSPVQIATVTEGQSVMLLWNDAILLRGAVDQRLLRAGVGGTTLELSGRSRGGILGDCSVPLNWRVASVSLADIADLAVKQLGLNLDIVRESDDASKLFKAVYGSPGESWWELLTRLAERRRCLVWETPAGLHVGRPDYESAPVGELRWAISGARVARNNILSSEITWATSGRRSPVTVADAAGDADLWGGPAKVTRATDPVLVELGLSRPLVLSPAATDAGDQARTKNAAQAEVSRRAGEAFRATYHVQGVGPTASVPWAVNTNVVVRDEGANVDGTYWIQAVQVTGSRDGHFTTLFLRERGAIQPESV